MAGRVTDAVTSPQWKTYRGDKPKKVAIRQVGKVGNAWLKYRKQWMRTHQPDWNDCYTCTDCRKPVHKSVITLDHREKRGSHPELRFNDDNIVPLCADCHIKKDSGMRVK